ncbi:MAG: glycerol-3-phosphate dehydrogenase [Spirochaetes bacterium GWD1_61_31]|nr:MAG: glycerol-3-phosphate dehydrogenase [Spirochaetes bacterium GWB1_60_80]OHD36181.1 MAG: glycerol-3-phosphate dehydrogenase [Spirochaetes bacterium GWD1_61_31]OHD43245.1 MAG: glycerol-3-phosphate dehydrogenase [Spirochaetes bacterium GWE1_60_18]OHD58805.1 MAG: glycerol-3-phosphate dehydrogenase [Spirochaetes bacterium GWF1_60_12]HAP43327.1 glycerol-3-phosphate dehydrogenase [Spirochaetaceae bacterium]
MSDSNDTSLEQGRRSVAVIGAGAWGTAVAKACAENGHQVSLWALEAAVVESVNRDHENKTWLPGVKLPDNLSATADPVEAALAKDVIILAVPSLYLLPTLKRILAVPNVMEGSSLIAVVTKGFIETSRGTRLIIETLEDYLPGFYRGNLVYISGPSHAEEVSRGLMTGLVAASANGRNGIRMRELLQRPYLLVYPSLDVIGVQVCGGAKNVVAIAFGMLDSLKATSDAFGDNTESLLLAAGLNEIQLLGQALGATHPETFTSIAGVGDLDVTCRSVHGRNRRFGRDIVEKNILEPFTDIKDLVTRINRLPYLPEGAVAAGFVRKIINEKKLAMPICNGVYRILNRELTPQEFAKEFLSSLSSRNKQA